MHRRHFKNLPDYPHSRVHSRLIELDTVMTIMLSSKAMKSTWFHFNFGLIGLHT